MFDDSPIQSPEQDRLGRSRLAESIALELHGPASIVAAITGPWGSGKTSVLNLVKARLASNEATVVIEFNPWFFSGTEQLIAHFFAEFAAQLRTDKEESHEAIADRLDAYGRVLEPLAEVPVIGWLAKIFRGGTGVGSQVARRGDRFHRPSLREEREALEAALLASNVQFVVIVDDIDRLQTEEIRDVVRLVRLVGQMPRTTYLLAFDRVRVEKALGDDDVTLGRDYLEKIVQVMYALPEPSRDELLRLTLEFARPRNRGSPYPRPRSALLAQRAPQGHRSTNSHTTRRQPLRKRHAERDPRSRDRDKSRRPVRPRGRPCSKT